MTWNKEIRKVSRTVIWAAIANLLVGWLAPSGAKAQAIENALFLDLDARMAEVVDRVRDEIGFLPSGAEAAIYSDVSKCMALARFLDIQELTAELNRDLITVIDLVHAGEALSENSEPILDAYYAGVWWSVFKYQTELWAQEDVEVAMATWDLDCAGAEFFLSFPPYQSVQIAASAIFENGIRESFATYDETRRKIKILGEVTQGFHNRLVSALDDVPFEGGDLTVSLGSGGGNVAEAVAAARILRERGVKTELYNTCESACPFVFLGGVERWVWHPAPRIGFHMLRLVDGGDLSRNHELYDEVKSFVDEMGADGSKFVDFMHAANPSDMFYPEIQALCDANIVTWAQRMCF